MRPPAFVVRDDTDLIVVVSSHGDPRLRSHPGIAAVGTDDEPRVQLGTVAESKTRMLALPQHGGTDRRIKRVDMLRALERLPQRRDQGPVLDDEGELAQTRLISLELEVPRSPVAEDAHRLDRHHTRVCHVLPGAQLIEPPCIAGRECVDASIPAQSIACGRTSLGRHPGDGHIARPQCEGQACADSPSAHDDDVEVSHCAKPASASRTPALTAPGGSRILSRKAVGIEFSMRNQLPGVLTLTMQKLLFRLPLPLAS